MYCVVKYYWVFTTVDAVLLLASVTSTSVFILVEGNLCRWCDFEGVFGRHQS